jgi:hypothetical protein
VVHLPAEILCSPPAQYENNVAQKFYSQERTQLTSSVILIPGYNKAILSLERKGNSKKANWYTDSRMAEEVFVGDYCSEGTVATLPAQPTILNIYILRTYLYFVTCKYNLFNMYTIYTISVEVYA